MYRNKLKQKIKKYKNYHLGFLEENKNGKG